MRKKSKIFGDRRPSFITQTEMAIAMLAAAISGLGLGAASTDFGFHRGFGGFGDFDFGHGIFFHHHFLGFNCGGFDFDDCW